MSTRRKTRMYTCVVLGFGYSEDSSLAHVWFVSECGFSTPQNALRDLALQMYGKYKANNAYQKSACCTAFSKNSPDFKFCPQCGKSIDPSLDFDEYNVWLIHMTAYSVDEWGPSTELDGWSPWVSFWDVIKAGEGSIINISQSEFCLIAALDPQSVDEEDRQQLIEYQENNNLDFENLSNFIDNPEH